MPHLTDIHKAFLRQLYVRGGEASARSLGPQTSQAENSGRQHCKRLGLVSYADGRWKLTMSGWDYFNHS